MEKISWTVHVRNEEMLRSQRGVEYPTCKEEEEEEEALTRLVTTCAVTAF